jgi:hypothetical protein
MLDWMRKPLIKEEHPVKNLAIIETILRNQQQFFAEIKQRVNLGKKMKAMIISSLIFFALHGAVMGSSHGVWQALSSAAKLPLLFLTTLVICSPTLYFFNLLFGSDQSPAQHVVLVLTAITVTSVLLLSFSPIVLFFLLTTSHYQFFKLLNVTVFAIAGIIGVVFLIRGTRLMSEPEGTQTRRYVVYLWIVVYAFVGSQMAWTLRPFVGAPGLGFELFRQLGGNFYANIFASIGEILGFLTVR